MSVEIKYPGVYVEEIPVKGKSISGVTTSTAAFAGWSSIGPTDRTELVGSWVEFETKFGGLDERSLLGYSVYHFFDNGGRQAYIVRIAEASSDSDSPQVLEPNTPEFEDALLPNDGKGGLYLLDDVSLFNLLCVPGETDPPTVSKLQKFSRDRRAFLILDCAENAGFEQLINGPGNIAQDDALNSAFYFPWILAPDSLKENKTREFPPCGFVAGLYARTDATRGVWKAPAGSSSSLNGATGLAQNKTLTDSENGLLNRKAINCIRTFPTYGTVAWGARTLHGNDERASDWKYVPVRRTALFIEESIVRGLKWAVFEPNDEPLWAQIRQTVGDFLYQLFRQGSFQGTSPKDAYFVKCGRETTTQSEIDSGIVNILVGFAPLKPAEFVIIKLQQLTGQARAIDGLEIEVNVMAKSKAGQRFDPYKNFKFRIVANNTLSAKRDDLRLPEDELGLLDQIVDGVTQKAGETARGISALFSGEKGTGKTLAAEVIANRLGLDVHRIDLSSVVSDYIGETEKNLKKVFDAAEEAGAVLVFDEADALFGKRSEVKDSHDRYANIEVNYLLQRLEDYKGVAILTTNRKESIDSAFLRRLRYVVNFPEPSRDGQE